MVLCVYVDTDMYILEWLKRIYKHVQQICIFVLNGSSVYTNMSKGNKKQILELVHMCVYVYIYIFIYLFACKK